MPQSLTRLLLLTGLICCMEKPGLAESSLENPMGWRRDGSGKYPNTLPALTWERRIKTPLSSLAASLHRPVADDNAKGEPLRRREPPLPQRNGLSLDR